MTFDRKIVFIAAVIYCITAIFSTGYYHPDEHYQIVEFAELKTGLNTPADLTWEYHSRIRSAVQPLLFYVLSTLLNKVNITDHYIILTTLRLATGLLALIMITFFVSKTKKFIPASLHDLYALLSFFLWFLPFLNVRFSSETMSGLMFLGALGAFYGEDRKKWLLTGVLLSLSFLFRFQSAFMSLGFLLWLICVQKTVISNILKMAIGAGVGLGLGILIDSWYYQDFTFTPYNYFFQNIVNNMASNFGTEPWYFYFTALFNQAGLGIALLILVCLLLYFIIKPNGVLTWVIVPFLLIHLVTPHKEFRFLFPLANLMPLLIVSTLSHFMRIYFTNKPARFSADMALAVLAVCNVLFMITVMLSPADKGYINVTEYINKNYPEKRVHLYGHKVDDPYNPFYILHQNYFLNRRVTFESFKPPLMIKENSNDVSLILIHAQDHLQAISTRNLTSKKIKLVYTSMPIWLSHFKTSFSSNYANQNLYLFEVMEQKN